MCVSWGQTEVVRQLGNAYSPGDRTDCVRAAALTIPHHASAPQLRVRQLGESAALHSAAHEARTTA